MNYVAMLRNANLKATPQRLSVLKFLGEHTHPTIDELYAKITAIYPSVSLATVYKNLAALIDKRLVVEVNYPNQKPKYDIYERPHIHIICENCGAISDLFCEDAKMGEYREILEKKIGNFIENLNITAAINGCNNCQ